MADKRLERLQTVFDRIIAQCKADEDNLDMYVDQVDAMLDGLLSDDAFGTEGQTDPRGDQRNAGSFSIDKRIEA